MAQSTVLSARTAAGNGDFTVGSTPVTIIMFAADGKIDEGIQCPIKRKVGSNYQPAFGRTGPAFLTANQLEYTVYAAGDYRVVKPETDEQIGFVKDET